jgi:hypothetical protein
LTKQRCCRQATSLLQFQPACCRATQNQNLVCRMTYATPTAVYELYWVLQQ